MRIGKVVWGVVFFVAVLAAETAHAQAPGAPEFQPPQFLNRAELGRIFNEYYPLALRKQGIGGTAQVRLFVDTQGIADSVQLTGPMGIPELDRAAVSIARLMRFTPAQVGGEPRGLWLEMPIVMLPPERIDSPSVNTIALANRAEIVEILNSETPKAVRTNDIAVDLDFWVEIDADGAVVDVDLEDTSCFRDIDLLGHLVARQLKFEPAAGNEGPINGWTMIKLRVNQDSTYKEYIVELEGDAEIRKAKLAAERDSTADSRKPKAKFRRPELLNAKAITKLLQDMYPPGLRERGEGGSANVMVWVDEKGSPGKRMISKSSGLCEVDLTALAVTKSLRFRPAMHDDKPVPVVVTFPVNFRVN